MITPLLSGCTYQTMQPVEKISIHQYAISQEQIQTHLTYLSSDQLQGRKVGTKGSLLTQQYLSENLSKLGVLPFESTQYIHPFNVQCSFNTCPAANIIGYIKAKNETDNTIVLSAHYDHLGMNGRNVYNGADDNASGVTALLTIGEQLVQSPLKQNVVLLFTDAEESNLKGAYYFFEHHKDDISKLRLNINLDMLAGSRSTNKLHYIYGHLLDIFDRNIVQQFKQRHFSQNIRIRKGFKFGSGLGQLQSNRRWQTASDHGVFFQNKLPFIYYGVGEHENYHTALDDIDHINKEFLWHSINIIYQQLVFISQNLE